MANNNLWDRFKQYFFHDASTGFSLDVSRVKFPENYLSSMAASCSKALAAMQQLEKGAIANPDEQRMVGHYWLRDPEKAANKEIASSITTTLKRIQEFAADIHSGTIAPEKGGKFEAILLIGIGGSALGPQFVTRALTTGRDPMNAYFFDNTDPDGMALVLNTIPALAKTLCVVISKSGGTPESRNGMLVAKAAFEREGLQFNKHVVAITSEGSNLDKVAEKEKWIARFPMWDWVGGRTSELSAVGLLPAALQGFPIEEILRGAREMDKLTSESKVEKNPAMLLALMWHYIGGGKGTKDMVVLPYSDRLELFSRYLQQLVMESLGKEKDLDGKVVHQGIAVYGNKGSTDQHAYVQQLRDGLNNFFAVFIKVDQDQCKKSSAGARSIGKVAYAAEVDPGITCSDYLSGFFQGTRRALYENDRQSISIFVRDVSEHTVGMLIALFERAVGLYASLVNINAYHQPGVEAGKKAAATVLARQGKVLEYLQNQREARTADEIAHAIGDKENAESVFLIASHLAANSRLKRQKSDQVWNDRFSI